MANAPTIQSSPGAEAFVSTVPLIPSDGG